MESVEPNDPLTDAFMLEWNAFMNQDEPQLFVQIINLAGVGANPSIGLRYFGADFMAECSVLRPQNKRPRRIKATGTTIEETLNNLASNVAGYLYPVKEKARDA